MKNLKNTKTRLTIIFTLIISVLFLIIGSSFFVFKYYSDKENINNKIIKIEKIILNKQKEINNFIENNSSNHISKKEENKEIENILDFTRKLFKNPDADFGENRKTVQVEEILVEGKNEFKFFNEKIIVFDSLLTERGNPLKNKILYSNIEDSEKIDLKKYINLKNGVIYEDKLAVLKTNIGNKKALVFIERKYTLKNLFYDIGYLILGVIFFSLIFYFIGNIFVKRALKPVEENIEEMNNFIDNAGHELKTPLAAINSSAGLLKEMKNFEPELIQEILDETNKSAKIIGALRSLTKISKNAKTENFSIKSVLKKIIISQKENIKKKNLKLELNTKDKDIEINANKNYFYILASNIIGNAIKYNKDYGKLVIKIENNSLIITDTGIGIPKEETKKVFERFYRTKNHSKVEGHGLGLSMVEKIARIYNWKINIESIEDIGTKVIIRF